MLTEMIGVSKANMDRPQRHEWVDLPVGHVFMVRIIAQTKRSLVLRLRLCCWSNRGGLLFVCEMTS